VKILRLFDRIRIWKCIYCEVPKAVAASLLAANASDCRLLAVLAVLACRLLVLAILTRALAVLARRLAVLARHAIAAKVVLYSVGLYDASHSIGRAFPLAARSSNVLNWQYCSNLTHWHFLLSIPKKI
jgi:hypothetical protein